MAPRRPTGGAAEPSAGTSAPTSPLPEFGARPRQRQELGPRSWVSRTRPLSAEVTVRDPLERTPRRDMHRCSASSTTPTPFGCSCLGDEVRHLGRQALLDLEAPGEVVDDPGELRQPEEPLVGEIAHMGDARERQQVVLTERGEGDGPGDDQLVVALVVGERRRLERLGCQQLCVRPRRAARRCHEVVTGALHAQRIEQVRDGTAGPLEVDRPGGQHLQVGCPPGWILGRRAFRLEAALRARRVRTR